MRRVLATVLPIVALAATAASLPRLAVEYATSCTSCHVNPSGGGMRTEFGNHSVAFQELTLQATKSLLADRYRPPRIAEAVTIGFDTRHLVFDDGSVFRMQTDAFAAVEPIQNLVYQFRVGESGISENFALLSFGDLEYYVKAGRFSPAFGLHPEDHTAFVRQRTGNPPLLYLDGISVGAAIHPVHASLEAHDRSGQGVYGVHLFSPLALPSFSIMIGASIRITEDLPAMGDALPHAKALFGGISWSRFTLMGEADVVGKGNDTIVTYANLTTRLMYGVYLIGEYNFFDGDKELTSGVEEFVRVSVELYPVPFVQVRPTYTRYTEGPLRDEDDLFVLFHVGY
ncbi:MAG: hypothetical protein RBT76_12665 [candidate division Zixibacteria bacterium]|nr:hypothetical protein [candidate division Zixibacteria bacterium]